MKVNYVWAERKLKTFVELFITRNVQQTCAAAVALKIVNGQTYIKSAQSTRSPPPPPHTHTCQNQISYAHAHNLNSYNKLIITKIHCKYGQWRGEVKISRKILKNYWKWTYNKSLDILTSPLIFFHQQFAYMYCKFITSHIYLFTHIPGEYMPQINMIN